MKDNVIQTKSFNFAIEIIETYKLLQKKKEFILAKQLLRSGTSVGANIEEAIGGQSKKDFISKLSIAYKEARESLYWIRLLEATGYLESIEAKSIKNNANEICKILSAILVSTKNNLSK